MPDITIPRNANVEQAVGATLMRLKDMGDGSHAEVVFAGPVTGAVAGVATPWSYAAAAAGILNTAVAVPIKAAVAGQVASVRSLQIMAEALGVATELAIRDGAGGTVLWRTKIGMGGLTAGLAITFASPLRGTAGNLLEVVTLTASVTGAVYVNAQGESTI